ncbi:hypothetical protein HMPREF2852_06555 [Anaerococcus sp. HMSC065G05]|uniref:hypothetical protein n=1 Tax=Anaerococcus sp. HMSC065G05 TaxID=1739356 RepID=UPI0008A469D9|nr:hypothetical protein [Anaerococcus sp. HMSC065G05]OFJ69688.1 hypothetical protein HMPREF2852_06555 [Anaerococcus sp. HMSC065G05]
MDKVYVIIQNDDGASDGFGDYVTLVRIFTDRKEANKKLKELECEYKNKHTEDKNEDINYNCIHCCYDDYDEDYDYDDYDDTRYIYKLYEIPLSKTVGKYLGGYAELDLFLIKL